MTEVTKKKLHSMLKMYQNLYGDELYVQVVHSDNIKHGIFWAFTKEVLSYDYYKLNENN